MSRVPGAVARRLQLALLHTLCGTATWCRAQSGCECEGWEEHPNTYWSGGEQETKDGITIAQCKTGCCESDACIAYGHCMQDTTSCLWPIASQHCTWYKTAGSRLTRSDGHFTGIFHAAQHCKPVPGGGGGGGDDVVPQFSGNGNAGWCLAVLGCVALFCEASQSLPLTAPCELENAATLM